jgi:uncharacterized membrane protein
VRDRDPKLWAALSYSLGLISGAIVLSMEKRDAFVRFHAWQSVLAFAVALFASPLIPAIPVIGGWFLAEAAFRLGVVLMWILLIVRALQGRQYRLPLLGDVAASMTASSSGR